MPAVPAELAHPDTLAIDVTGEPLPDWVVGVDPLPPDAVERAPPNDWDCIDGMIDDPTRPNCTLWCGPSARQHLAFAFLGLQPRLV